MFRGECQGMDLLFLGAPDFTFWGGFFLIFILILILFPDGGAGLGFRLRKEPKKMMKKTLMPL